MLTNLKIQNVALVADAEVEFGAGFNALTGETGAGKSIILGSLGFIMGEKLGKHMVRTGCELARVTASFLPTSDSSGLSEMLAKYGIDDEDGQLVITRTLRPDGKGDTRINGQIVTASACKEIASLLVDMHGQHDTATLLKSANHLSVLDDFGLSQQGGRGFAELLAEYGETYAKWRELERTLKSLGGDEGERARQIDLYEFQINEIENANLRDGEEEELTEQRTRLVNFERIATNLGQALSSLQGSDGSDGGAMSGLRRAISALSSVAQFDPELKNLGEEAEGLMYSLSAIEDGVSAYLNASEYDEAEFARVDKRLDDIKSLKRKYGKTIAEILGFLERTRTSCEGLKGAEETIKVTQNQIQGILGRLRACGDALSEKRREVARVLEAELLGRLRPLGMPAVSFEIEFLPPAGEEISFTCNGVDNVEFRFSANKGEPLKPLSTVISGGELSRFMLALKSITGSSVTLVFDEIDTGIGGQIGRKVGERMLELSKSSQVIAVTHLPQIASLADHHFLIKKHEDQDRTQTTVHKLDKLSREAELQRMTG